MAPDFGPSTSGRRLSVSLQRASRSLHAIDSRRQTLQDRLCCTICLDLLALPVCLTCFSCPNTRGPWGVRGHHGNHAWLLSRLPHNALPMRPHTHAANSTCLRGNLCQHCANEALQLDRPPAERFPEEGGRARCLICRLTTVDARALTPVRAYHVNHVLMDVMDSLDLGAACRWACQREY